MAGKSTFLRQNALIVILAQMGSCVPAESAEIGVVDKLFSRVGAADDLARGRSTFMVEMVETAAILNQATARSLVILDEIGRGTATFDGLSIAWATLEHLHEVNKCRALFATHYHELTSLAARLPETEAAHHEGDGMAGQREVPARNRPRRRRPQLRHPRRGAGRIARRRDRNARRRCWARWSKANKPAHCWRGWRMICRCSAAVIVRSAKGERCCPNQALVERALAEINPG